MNLPADPSLVGLVVAFQGSGAGLGSQFVLGSSTLTQVE